MFKNQTNPKQRGIKAFVIGRKNWMFTDTLRGAFSSTAMYSLFQSAAANGLNPYWYFRYFFAHLPYVKTEDDLRRLLPTEVTKEELLEFQAKCL